LNGRRDFLKIAVAAVVSSVVTGVGAWGVMGSKPLETVTVTKPPSTVTVTKQLGIVCPVDGSPYAWTPIGSRSENFNWLCLKCGHTWVQTYPEDVYKLWREAFLSAEYVRDYTILCLRGVEETSLPDPLNLNWLGGLVVPDGQENHPLGYSTFYYTADELAVTVGYPIVLPENTVYNIKIEWQGKTVWEGELFQREFKKPTIIKPAIVNDIDIQILESFPVQVRVIARGDLSDSCTEIGEIKTSREGNSFSVNITTSRPADIVCAQVVTPFEEIISLDVVGLKAGSYTVDVNGVRDTFELQVDNIAKTQDIEVDAGEEFAISLDSNPTTGYQWQLVKPLDESVLQLIGSEYKPPETKLVGAGGKEVWTFKAMDSGTAEISLVYVRSWEKDVPPAEERTYNVTVR
jgi:inhibitor of cysteine peptidase